MIKKFSKSLLAAVCVASLILPSCKKDSLSNPESPAVDATMSNASFASSSTTSSINSFTLGVNGHPLGDLAYLGIPATDQIKMIQNMGMGIYRIGILSTSDGTCTVPKILQPLVEAANAGKITLLPMLTPRTLDYNDSESAAYAKGKTLGGNFAAKYAATFKYYDMGNDLDVKLILAGKDGRSTDDYNQSKLRITAAYLKGMNDGIHANDPDAQTMISAGWVHWGFIKYCENYGVKFDVLAYHWYSDMEAAIKRATSMKITDITVTLNGLFPGKPIFITETNARPKDLDLFESEQNTFLVDFIAKCKANPTVKAVLVYELFDEPYKNKDEKYYGIAKWALPYTKFVNKLAAETLVKLHLSPSTSEPAKPSTPVTPVTPSVPVVTELLTDLLGFTSNKPQSVKVAAGIPYYTDRDYQIKSAPSYLLDASLIKTANNDKVSKQNSFLSFKLSKAATVYVAYDPRGTRIPTWLQGFTKTTDKLAINDPKIANLTIYKKDYTAGTVTLGGNLAGNAFGALCQYVAMVK